MYHEEVGEGADSLVLLRMISMYDSLSSRVYEPSSAFECNRNVTRRTNSQPESASGNARGQDNALMSFICLRTVLLPDSPAPRSSLWTCIYMSVIPVFLLPLYSCHVSEGKRGGPFARLNSCSGKQDGVRWTEDSMATRVYAHLDLVPHVHAVLLELGFNRIVPLSRARVLLGATAAHGCSLLDAACGSECV